MDWNQLTKLVSELPLVDQVRFAELKGVAVPDDVKAQVAKELAVLAQGDALKKHVKFVFGTRGQPGRVYLKTGGLLIAAPVDGKARYAKGMFLETRGIDEAIAVLTKAQEECARRGIPTGPSNSDANSGRDAAPEKGDIRDSHDSE